MLKIRLSLLILLFSMSATFLAAQQQTEAASKVLALENKWNVAYKQGDIATLNSLLEDDFIITVEEGATFSKAGYLAHCSDSDIRVLISEMSDLKVRVHGNAAIVTGAYREKGTSKGKPYEYHDRFTDVWILMDGRWQLIASHYAVPSK